MRKQKKEFEEWNTVEEWVTCQAVRKFSPPQKKKHTHTHNISTSHWTIYIKPNMAKKKKRCKHLYTVWKITWNEHVIGLVHSAWLDVRVPLDGRLTPFDMKREAGGGHRSHRPTRRIPTAIPGRAGGAYMTLPKLVIQHAEDQWVNTICFACKVWTQVMSREERKWEGRFGPAVPYSKNFPSSNISHTVSCTIPPPSLLRTPG